MKARHYGFGLPFLSGSTVMPRQVDERLIKNNVLLLINTMKQERLHRDDLGSNVHDVPFDQIDDARLSTIEDDISRTISAFEDRVSVVSVIAARDDDGKTINISIELATNGDQATRYLLQLELLPDGSMRPQRT